MRRGKPTHELTTNRPATKASNDSPLSLSRLRDAFAAMLGGTKEDKPARARKEPPTADEASSDEVAAFTCEINAQTVVEAILFVGRPDNGPHSARELAAAMRGVSPGEVEAAVAQLNATYGADGTPYHIEQNNGGYRLVLRTEFERMRDKFYGRIKEARLSPAVLEVLSVLAYNQPATVDHVNELRGAPSGAALSTLVRRKLAKLERSGERGKPPQYSTTDRFLKLFGLETLDSLPQTEDLEKV